MVWAYVWDAPSRTLTANGSGLSAGAPYTAGLWYLNPFDLQSHNLNADGGGNLSFVFQDVVIVAKGNMFGITISDGTTGEYLACNVFTINVSSVTGDGVTALISHDGGNNYSIQITSIAGRTYRFSVGSANFTGGGGSMTWSGSGGLETQTLDLSGNPLTPGSPAIAFLNDADNAVPGNSGPLLADGFLTQGTAGNATGTNPGGGTYNPASAGNGGPPEGTWSYNYNGSNTFVAVGSGLQPGRNYVMFTDASTGGRLVATANGSGNATFTDTSLVDPSSFGDGPMFAVVIESGVQYSFGSPFGAVGKAANIFTYGVASTTGDGISPVAWSFDGTIITVTFPTVVGINYNLDRFTGQGSSDGPVLGDGTDKTLHFTIDVYPAPIYIIEVTTDTGGFDDEAIRVFQYGVLGVGTPGNPGGSGPAGAVLHIWSRLSLA